MTKQVFMKIFDAMRNQRTYSSGEMARIYHHVMRLEEKQFKSIVDKFLDRGGKPNVADFKNAARAINPNAYANKYKSKETEIDCKQCQDSSLVEIEINSIKVFAQCFCSQQFLSGINLPTYPSPKTNRGKYIGPGRVPFKPGVDSAVESMEHYKQQLRISEEFWKGLDNEKL